MAQERCWIVPVFYNLTRVKVFQLQVSSVDAWTPCEDILGPSLTQASTFKIVVGA